MKRTLSFIAAIIMLFAMIPMASATTSSPDLVSKAEMSSDEYQAIIDQIGTPNESNTIIVALDSLSATKTAQISPRANGVTNIWDIYVYALGHDGTNYVWYRVSSFRASQSSLNDNITISGFDYNSYYYAYEIGVKHNFASYLYSATWNGSTIQPSSVFYGKWLTVMDLNSYDYISATYFIEDWGMGGTFKSNGPITQPFAKFIS